MTRFLAVVSLLINGVILIKLILWLLPIVGVTRLAIVALMLIGGIAAFTLICLVMEPRQGGKADE